MTGHGPVQIDAASVEELTKRQVELLEERWPRSLEFAKRASQSLAGGVSCAWHALDPYTLYGDRGLGSKLWDIDGNEYVDLHNGYGVTIVGHAHPKVVEAVRRRVALGTHFALPTEDAVIVAENLQQRFGLPLWRFKNTGSEATVDVILNATTGVVGDDISGPLACLDAVRPEMAAMNAGSLNYLKTRSNGRWAWPPLLFANPVEKIEKFLAYMYGHGIVPECECFDTGIVRSIGMFSECAICSWSSCVH